MLKHNQFIIDAICVLTHFKNGVMKLLTNFQNQYNLKEYQI